MRLNWPKIKDFWTAEEVPRWIGMSLVGVFLVGSAAAGYRAVSDARNDFSGAIRRSNERSVDFLTAILSQVTNVDPATEQRALLTFARSHRCEQLRIVDGQSRVVASIHSNEIGRPNGFNPGVGSMHPARRELHALSSSDDLSQRWLFRAPLTPSSTARADGGESAGTPDVNRVVEGVLLTHIRGTSPGMPLATVVTILVVGAMFFGVYRALRRHFRSLSRISENLLSRGDSLEQDLLTLRLDDADGAVAEQWNRLIDIVDELSTESKRTKASVELKNALEQSRHGELADVMNAVPDGVLYVAERDTLAYANTMGRRLMGLKATTQERVRLRDIEGNATAEQIASCIESAMGPDGSYSTLTKVIDADAGASSYRLRLCPLTKDRRQGECVVVISDISQQVRADRAREEFVTQVTHELRTPLTNIRAYTETLSSGVFDDPEVITECYNVITKETRRLSRLIEDILSISQLEVGAIQLRVDDVDLSSLLQDAVRDLRGLADEKQIDMQVSLASKLPAFQGDRDKLAVVLNNLLGNALKYTHSGGSVTLGCQSTADEVLISVKDDGIGIDSSEHSRIFEKFQRSADAEVGAVQGTGIGLTTAREIARRHGGDIEVVSTKGDGATFIVHLPLSTTGAPAVGAHSE